MTLRRAVYLIIFFFISISAEAQINLYLGGNVQANYSWIRGEAATFNPGFGGGVSFVYWEYEYWFIKAGIDYHHKTSSILAYPDVYDVPVLSPDDKIRIEYTEQAAGVPLTIYFRPYESGSNALLITGTLEMMVVTSLKVNSEEYGELQVAGGGAGTWAKTNVGIGVGYQRQLQEHTYLNIIPSYNVDIRASPAYNSITLSVELIFGIY